MKVATQLPETVMHEPSPTFATEEESFNHQLEHQFEGSLVSALLMESIMVKLAEKNKEMEQPWTVIKCVHPVS